MEARRDETVGLAKLAIARLLTLAEERILRHRTTARQLARTLPLDTVSDAELHRILERAQERAVLQTLSLSSALVLRAIPLACGNGVLRDTAYTAVIHKTVVSAKHQQWHLTTCSCSRTTNESIRAIAVRVSAWMVAIGVAFVHFGFEMNAVRCVSRRSHTAF